MLYKLNNILLIVFLTGSIFAFDTPDKLSKKPKPKKIYFSLEKIKMNVLKLDDDKEWYEKQKPVTNPACVWKSVMTQMRVGSISKEQTIDSVRELCTKLKAHIKEKGLKTYTDYEWVFPVRGYNSSAIGGKNGNGFNPYGFSFYDLNSSGHPAQDIFIKDKDQDCIDDITGTTVDILSMSSGIVVETRTNWTSEMMDIKGGNIIYIYDNYSNGFFYYAHLKDVSVKVGDYVKPGSILGTIGRTGKNAYPKRSPTHLHIMYVRSNNGDLIPENIYNILCESKVIF
jgi:hypothetical protein